MEFPIILFIIIRNLSRITETFSYKALILQRQLRTTRETWPVICLIQICKWTFLFSIFEYNVVNDIVITALNKINRKTISSDIEINVIAKNIEISFWHLLRLFSNLNYINRVNFTKWLWLTLKHWLHCTNMNIFNVY